ncbi:hypothetical protein GDO81_017500 [Engystomops pustulosus]|uniref:Uncharacterized protein n=1 Tax=Engystomops pustulosus TaxID=76066 RepID=A0AAV7AFF6_ENGPU|nr:hypothetical protein GDO81_017500 [Engystomops pustulosus]
MHLDLPHIWEPPSPPSQTPCTWDQVDPHHSLATAHIMAD